MKKFLLTFALLWAPTLAWGQGLPANTEIAGCVASASAPTFVQGYYGQLSCDLAGNLRTTGAGGGGGGASQTASNASDGQATSTTNQQNLVFNMLFNGTTWDRMRGTGGALNVALTSLGGGATAANQASEIAALGTPGDAANATTIIGQLKQLNVGATPAGSNVIGKVGIDQTTPGTTNGVANYGFDGTTWRSLLTTTTGALEPPTAASGKITRTSTAVAASTSTTIAAANTNRIAFGVQCATGAVSVDETGGTLTAAGVGNGTLFIPSGTAPYFTPPIATRTAITAYTATTQTCVVTEYLR